MIQWGNRMVAVAAIALVAVGALVLWRGADEGPAADLEAAAGPIGGEVEREPIPLDHEGPIPITVYMSPQCGCCGGWVEHLTEHGFEPEVHAQNDMSPVKETFRIPWELSSCHTAIVNGYVIEGHVPAGDIRRLLADAPEAHGLTAPGMPVGSPGMEAPDGRVEAYEVLLMRTPAETEVFARHSSR